jgi:hypothetical protein
VPRLRVALSALLALLAVLTLTAPASADVARTGKVQVIHGHDFARGTSLTQLVLVTDQGRLLLDGLLAKVPKLSGAVVKVTGDEEGGVLHAEQVEVVSTPSTAAVEAPVSERKVAVILFNFAENKSQPYTAEQVRARFFGNADSANGFYREDSNGAVGLAGDVFGWYTLSASSYNCDWPKPDAWGDQAIAAAEADGHPMAGYDNVVFVMPQTPSCRWAGLGYMPGTRTWVNGTLDTGAFAHELGHNFGLDHAGTLACKDAGGAPVAMSGTCTKDEYGDPFDVMGDAFAATRDGNTYGRQNHAWHLLRLGFRDAGSLINGAATGDYTFGATEAASGPRGLRIPTGDADGSAYVLELRQPEGLFDTFAATDPVVQGVSVRLVPFRQGGMPHLVDATPQTPTFADAALPVGATFSDTARRLNVTTTAVGDGAATVHVEFTPVGSPTVAGIAPSKGATGVAPGANVSVTFSEAMDRAASEAAFALRTGGGAPVAGTFSWNAASTVMTFDPSASLPVDATHDVTVARTATDASGLPLAAAFASSFSTDVPAVTAVDPANGAQDVSVGRNVVVTFSRAMSRSVTQGAFALRREGTTTNVSGTFTWNASSTQMTFDPGSSLAASSRYDVTVGTGARDAAGQALAAPLQSSFRSDSTPPAVAAIDPADAAQNVAADRNVVVTFSEPMQRTATQSAFALRRSGSTTKLGGGFSWNAASTVMTFNPTANFTKDTVYAVTVGATAKDAAGMALPAAVTSAFRSDAQPPSVLAIDPAAGATGVALNRNVVVTFSEPMSRSATQSAFALRRDGSTTRLSGTYAWNAASTVLTFNPSSNLVANAGYTASIGTGAKDVVGYALPAAATSAFRAGTTTASARTLRALVHSPPVRTKPIALLTTAVTAATLVLAPAATEAGHARNCGRMSDVVGSRDVQVYAKGRTSCRTAKRWTPRWMRSRREPSGYNCRNLQIEVVFVCRSSSKGSFYAERR